MTIDLTDEDLVLPDELEQLVADLPRLADGETPAPYPHAEVDEREAQDDLDELGGPGDAPHTPRQAAQTARAWISAAVFMGVGYCLKAMRSIFGINALYPDAETAWEEAEHRHLTSDPMAIPWGVLIFWVNGGYGHVAFSIGRGRCITTDYVRTGYLGVAPIAALASWCGGRLVGWTEDVNGVRFWKPTKAKPDPKPTPKPLGIEDRIEIVERALVRARKNKAPKRRIQGLRKWLQQLESRRDAKGRKA